MKKTVWLWELFGFAFTSLGGTLLHFLYDFTKKSVWVASFSGVNESTWEHMKLFFWPAFIFAVIQSFFFKERRDFWCIKLRGMLIGLVAIPLIFYMYNGVIGKSPDWINITIFFLAGAISYVYETRQLNQEDAIPTSAKTDSYVEEIIPVASHTAGCKVDCTSPRQAFFTLCAIGLLFVIFTFATPNLSIFKDPITGAYGI